MGQWLDECIEQTGDEDDFLPNAPLYASYSQWCDDNGVMAKRKRSLTIALRGKGLDAGVIRRVDGKIHRGCQGIRLM